MAWLDWDGPSKGLCGGDPLGPIFICSGPFWLTGLGDPLVRGDSPTSFIFPCTHPPMNEKGCGGYSLGFPWLLGAWRTPRPLLLARGGLSACHRRIASVRHYAGELWRGERDVAPLLQFLNFPMYSSLFQLSLHFLLAFLPFRL